jgi:hypothetical protein
VLLPLPLFPALYIQVQRLSGVNFPYPLLIPSSTAFQVLVTVNNALPGAGNVTLTWAAGVDTVGPNNGTVSGRGTDINAGITDGQAITLIGTTSNAFAVYQIDGLTPGQATTGRQRNKGPA